MLSKITAGPFNVVVWKLWKHPASSSHHLRMDIVNRQPDNWKGHDKQLLLWQPPLWHTQKRRLDNVASRNQLTASHKSWHTSWHDAVLTPFGKSDFGAHRESMKSPYRNAFIDYKFEIYNVREWIKNVSSFSFCVQVHAWSGGSWHLQSVWLEGFSQEFWARRIRQFRIIVHSMNFIVIRLIDQCSN